MNNSRRKIRAQITSMNEVLQYQKNKVAAHKAYFAHTSSDYDEIKWIILVLSSCYIGWTIERKHVNKKLLKNVLKLGLSMKQISVSGIWNLIYGVVLYLLHIFARE